MRITYTAAVEFERPIGDIRSALADMKVWQLLVPHAEQLGHFWRYGDELYTVSFSGDDTLLRWDAKCVAHRYAGARIDITLRDALINTAADVAVTINLPSTPANLLRRGAIRRHVADMCRQTVERLRHELQSPPRYPQSEDPRDLAERYPRTLAAFAAMGARDHLERIERLDAAWDSIRGLPAKDRSPATANARRNDMAPIHEVIPSIVAAPVDQAGGARARPEGVHQTAQPDYDLIYAGGGLGLLHAVVMAQYGYRVMLFDRGEVGCAHREWNISQEELRALVNVGFCAWDDLRDVIMAEYTTGVVRFYAAESPAELRMPDVLNIALDANALLRLARRKLEAAGGTVLDHRAFRRVLAGAVSPLLVRVELEGRDGSIECHTARLLLDGMGSSSPLALQRFAAGHELDGAPQPFAGVCPTVGTVASGFAAGTGPGEHNSRVGDILVSVDDAQRGQQYMWEGFPGRGDELTVYLFYYDTLVKDERRKMNDANGDCSSFVRRPSPVNLMQLFEDYFVLLPSYKRLGPAFRHLKPVYGYIPARHSVDRQEAPLLRGVLPIGDSAAQQSPLTFCGFGSHIRNLGRTTALLHHALRHGLLDSGHLQPISAYQVNVSLNWVFSRFMQPWAASGDVNQLQNVFLRVLNDLGVDLARRFFRDQMLWRDYHQMILGMFRRHPAIVGIAWRVLGRRGVCQWIGDYLIYSRAALMAWLGRRLGARGRRRLVAIVERRSPALGLRLRAYYAEWQAMGWI
jgi:lycopene cyclase CruA